MNPISVFPTTIYQTRFDQAELHTALVKDIKAWRDEDPAGHPRSCAGTGWHSQTNAFQREAFGPICNMVLDAATRVFVDQGYRAGTRTRLVEMWANVHERGGWNAPHQHVGGLWSGIYYVRAPKGSGNVVFMDPRGELGVQPMLERAAAHGTVMFPPEPGRLILFPQWLKHYVEPHDGDLPRVSISFNIGQVQPQERPNFVTVPGVLAPDDITRLYAEIARSKWMRGQTGGGEVSDIRTSQVMFLDGRQGKYAWLGQKVARAAAIVNAEHYNLDLRGGPDLQLTRYGPGQEYKPHEDRGEATPGAARRSLSCSIILRNAEEGGAITFPRAPAQPENLNPGDAVFFPSSELHGGVAPTKGTRDALVVWFLEG